LNKLVYNIEEASSLLGISKSTLHRLTSARQLQKIQISDRRVGWSHSELIRFIADKENG
jgi:predicted DNA-binding transcriptional regulator AlpA